MREILFRGKTEQGEWVYGFYVEIDTKPFIFTGKGFTRHSESIFDEDGEYLRQEPYTLNAPERIGVIPSTIGQYTGLTDKNGTKIFEGDIVNVKFSTTKTQDNYEVKFEEYSWQSYNIFGENMTPFLDWDGISNGEVIGNIHEEVQE